MNRGNCKICHWTRALCTCHAEMKEEVKADNYDADLPTFPVVSITETVLQDKIDQLEKDLKNEKEICNSFAEPLKLCNESNSELEGKLAIARKGFYAIKQCESKSQARRIAIQCLGGIK